MFRGGSCVSISEDVKKALLRISWCFLNDDVAQFFFENFILVVGTVGKGKDLGSFDFKVFVNVTL